MNEKQLVLSPFVGSGSGDESRVIHFKQQPLFAGEFTLVKAENSAIKTVVVSTPGIYSISAAMRFQCLDDQGPVSNAWGITLNSFKQAERNVVNMRYPSVLAKALLAVPGAHEAQRQPIMTLTWIGFLGPGDELRVESEKEKPRIYQDGAEDRVCFFRVEKLV